jgi:membrane protease YdiL (CAAX protease family)
MPLSPLTRGSLGHRQAALFGALVLAMALGASVARGLPLDLYGWIPLAAAVIVVATSGRSFAPEEWQDFGIRLAGLRAWVPAVTIPAAVLTCGYSAAAVVGAVRLDLTGTDTLLFAVTTVVVLIAASLEAIGEEMGWRGYLQPRLADRGRVAAGLASGLLWAAWHVPLIYVAGAYHPGAGPLYLVAFAPTIVAMSFIANELRQASGSVWPAVIFHGAHNGTWFMLQGLVVGPSTELNRVGGESGIVPLALYWLVALWIIRRRPAWKRDSQMSRE